MIIKKKSYASLSDSDSNDAYSRLPTAAHFQRVCALCDWLFRSMLVLYARLYRERRIPGYDPPFIQHRIKHALPQAKIVPTW
jgi:hypothetical protein